MGSRCEIPDFPGAGYETSSRYTLTASAPFGSTKKHFKAKKSTGGRRRVGFARFAGIRADSVTSVLMPDGLLSFVHIEKT